MDAQTKVIFTKLNKDEFFSQIIEKITKNEQLSIKEYSYVLSLSILFYDEYKRKKHSGFMEFSYYLVLNYSIKTNDYTPLLMFALNNGLYPIVKSIFNNYDKNINDVIFENMINNYKKNDIYELKRQFETRKSLIESNAQNRAYIAPTSYGKSTAIIEDIKNCMCNKIGIIVPKKALIWQTFKNIKSIAKELNYKVLLHDTDYLNENRIICVFTQERAIRLIQDTDFSFEVLYIDEAHNLFEKDERNVLLARLIKLNKKKNDKQRVVYLSPLIKDANDLIFNENEVVDMHKIDFNIKEPNVRYLDNNLQLQIYNRFVNEYYYTNKSYSSCLDYIYQNMGKKNLLYFNKPKDIELFSQKLYNYLCEKYRFLNLSNISDIDEISKMIAKYVDDNYKLVELLKYGIVYIHGKMPDSIKDYLLDKFVKREELRFLISNSSILEGMNLSLDTMFVFDVYGMKQNNLINLCGRVNRLSDVFSKNDLSKLMCDIHFIDETKKSNFKSKISLLRSDENDNIQNPLLIKSELDEKGKKIAIQENKYINDYLNKDIRTILVKNGITSMYKDIDLISNYISNNLESYKKLKDIDLIDKILKIFFAEYSNISDYELARLCNEKAIRFYKNYIKNLYHKDLKSKVTYFKRYFEESKNGKFYIGESFGEISEELNQKRNVYINVKNKSAKEKVNLAVIKSKIEDDFIGFKLVKLVKTLLDLDLISESDYNKFLYGTNDVNKLQLIKMGLSPVIMNFIEINHLGTEIEFENGMIKVSKQFKSVLNNQDDFIKYEIEKLIF